MPLQASPRALRARILGRFAPSKLKKKGVSIDSKWSKTHKDEKKIFTSLMRFARSAASTASGEAQPYLPVRLLRSLGLNARILSRFAPSSFALLGRSLPQASRFSVATYPMTLPGSQGVSMPSFMTIGSKQWALEGYIHRYIVRP